MSSSKTIDDRTIPDLDSDPESPGLETVTAELRLSQQTLESIFRASPTGIGLVRDRVFVSVNRRLCRMLGYTEAELVGRDARMVYPDDEEYRLVGDTKYAQIAEQGIGTVETRWVTKDGRTLHVLLSSSPLDPTDPASPVTFTALDISARRQAAADLERSEVLLRTVAETVGDSVFVKDLDRRYTYVNQAMARTLGVTPADLLGKTPEEFFDPEAAAIIAEVDAATFAGETVNALRTLQVGGAQVTFHTVQAPLRDDHGEVVAVCGIVRDVSAQKRAEEERLAMMTRVQQAQKLESLGVLAGGIAHDFNNLLVGILGNAELAHLDLPEGSPVRGFVDDIERAALHARELVRQMLAYTGKGQSEIERVELPDLVEEMAQLLVASISKHARVEFDFAPETPQVEADVAQLRQVVMNLLTNASDALGTRAGTITVRTGSTTLDRDRQAPGRRGGRVLPGRYAFLEVSDTGCGMSRETLDRVFDPFFTTKLTGRGLGLAVVLGIVNGHGGTIDVTSEAGLGSTFSVLLPAAHDGPDPAAASPPSAEPWHGAGTVLLVDDEVMVRKVGQRLLERLGFDVIVAADGLEAVSIFRDQPERFACVLLDVAMPAMGGEACLLELRAVSPEVRVVMSSGFHEEDVRDRLREAGPIAFIQKPYTLGCLRETLRQVLEPG